MIRIDREKCKDCSACYDVCRANVFSRDSHANDGSVSVANAHRCIRCGYCISVCPADAMKHDGLSKSQFTPLPSAAVDPQSLEHLIFRRRSTRCFKNKAVPRDDIERLIEVAVHAGTGGNLQLENIVVIQDEKYLADLEVRVINAFWNNGMRFFKDHGVLANVLSRIYGKELSDLFKVYHKMIKQWKTDGDFSGKAFYHAPLLIAVHGRKTNMINQANCAIAVRNMELMAEAMGLATCWSGWLTAASTMSGSVNKFLGLDRSRRIGGALMVGYPKYRNLFKVPRNQRDITWI